MIGVRNFLAIGLIGIQKNRIRLLLPPIGRRQSTIYYHSVKREQCCGGRSKLKLRDSGTYANRGLIVHGMEKPFLSSHEVNCFLENSCIWLKNASY